MMTPAEILREIRQLPLDQQRDLKQRLLNDNGASCEPEGQMTQDVDRLLIADGFLVNLPLDAEEDDDFIPVEFSGKPISETIVEERR